jgi:hypothetical protein
MTSYVYPSNHDRLVSAMSFLRLENLLKHRSRQPPVRVNSLGIAFLQATCANRVAYEFQASLWWRLA